MYNHFIYFVYEINYTASAVYVKFAAGLSYLHLIRVTFLEFLQSLSLEQLLIKISRRSRVVEVMASPFSIKSHYLIKM